MVIIQNRIGNETSPSELLAEIDKLKTKTDEIDAEVKSVKQDVEAIKEKA